MRLWWDVRPHPRLGTLEIRMPDQPTHLAATAGLAALVQALVVWAEPVGGHADRGLYAQNRWAASRFGADAGLVHPEDRAAVLSAGAPRRAPRPRRADGARLGSAGFLGELDGLRQAGAQLELGRADGLRALCERLVALTYDGL